MAIVAGCSSAATSPASTPTGDAIDTSETTDAASAADASAAPDAGDTPGSHHSSSTTVVLGAVYTLDPARPWAEAFAYDVDGTIIEVGSADEVRSAAGDRARVIDAGVSMVLPGFQDVHVHVPEAGINLELCFLPAGLGLDDYAELAAECADEQPDAEWVRAAGASLNGLRDTDESPLDVLDRAIPDRPALVLDDLGHAVWTNSAGLAVAGIGPDDPDPQGGVLHRDADGRLTGLLLEDAQHLVRTAAAPDPATVDTGLAIALDELARHGVTTISDAGGYWLQEHPEAWLRAEAAGTLTVRAANTLYVYPSLDVDEQLAEFAARFRGDGQLLRFDTAKIYIDGILDLGTAKMIEPYDVPVDPDYPNGFSYFAPELLQTYVDELHALGYRINFHTIGDQAARDALDAVASIPDDADAVADRRHRTTHTYLVDPADRDRFARLGVVADFQLNRDAIDPAYHDYLSSFIGARAFELIPTAELLATGAATTLSSDWDAGELPPLGTIERALRRERSGVADLETALALMTIDAAYALDHDDTTGSIEVGKAADFVVLDRNLFDVDVDEIDEVSVLVTVLAGREVHRSDAFE